MLPHNGKDGAADAERPKEVGLEDRLRLVVGGVLDGATEPEAGAVHDGIESPYTIDDGTHCTVDRLRDVDVEPDHVEEHGPSGLVSQLRLDLGRRAPRRPNHVVTSLRQVDRTSASDPRRRPGDQYNALDSLAHVPLRVDPGGEDIDRRGAPGDPRL